MNDLLNNITKPRNTKELFALILKIVSQLYDKVVTEQVKK